MSVDTPDRDAAPLQQLLDAIRSCRLCERDLPRGARPVVQAGSGARLAVISQAPSSRVHATGIPWDDDSGERLRGWLGLDREIFFDASRVALVPMGFCYPGKASGGDSPPRRECAPLWHAPLLDALPDLRLTLLVGGYAQRAYLPPALRRTMTQAVRGIDAMPDGVIALPHPAWRSRLWMAKHPWFESDVLPVLRRRVAAALG